MISLTYASKEKEDDLNLVRKKKSNTVSIEKGSHNLTVILL